MSFSVLNFLALTIFLLGTYLIWFDKRNIVNHFGIGACFVAYLVPICVVDFSQYQSKSILSLYTLINTVGALSYVIGLYIGSKVYRIKFLDVFLKFNLFATTLSNVEVQNRLKKIIYYVYLSGIVGIIISYLIMGFLPIFAADPFAAKFFKGAYQAPYHRVAYIYRTSRQFVEIGLPLVCLEVISRRKIKDIVFLVLGVLLIVASLNRSTMLAGILLAMSIVISLKKRNTPFVIYVIFLLLTVVSGSALYYIITMFSSQNGFSDYQLGSNFFEAIAFGSPDITDQLNFLARFENGKYELTYGLTYWGGLIPFNYKYNPSSWTLYILNDTNDISEISSGGLRIPVSLWGYTSFGWFGVVLLPFISALFTGYIVRRYKIIINSLPYGKESYLQFFFIIFVFMNIAGIFMNFYLLSIYSLPSIVIYYIIIRNLKSSTLK
ncbi:O-antigen polymerase [Pedobacter sp. R20-19]|uniref:O-antigen polymerase n=1 Tax=Pedobacter sp. R20-19 TaxID=1270196 RepID=UPI0004931238|nr:O-antigen polymerase [Pedobacter sp. R20-19]